MFVDAKLRVHKKVTLGTNLNRLMYNMLIDILFLFVLASVNCKNIRRGYAQHKGFFVALTEHQKVGYRLIKLQETDIAESEFTLIKLALLQIILTLNNH